MARTKDTDYAHVSAYASARSAKLLSKERMDRMIDAPTDGEAARVLEECGISGAGESAAAMEQSLADRRAAVFAEFERMLPDGRVLRALRLKYDYHNIKVLVKSSALGVDAKYLLSDSGSVAKEKLLPALTPGEKSSLPEPLASDAAAAGELLASTGDPQLADIFLDKKWCAEALRLALESGADFLAGYMRLFIDSANLRAVVRAARSGRDRDFIARALMEGGSVSVKSLASCLDSPEKLERAFAVSPLREAAEAGAEAMRGGKMTETERACGNALTKYLASAQRSGFGDGPAVAYLLRAEGESGAVRIIMGGRRAGLPAEEIRRRLREV